ncbi:phosphatase PAP2 family protein [Flavobacterium sp.]|uniref:phosphatase PAP2 family protein n=1 Tax=Flavobacterium sp. TaxID=239 RepID=UPI002FDB3E06
MKNWILVFFCVFSISKFQAQALDTLSVLKNDSTQEFRITPTLSYQYQKPKFFDFITKIPNDFGIMGTMFIQKENLIGFTATVGATVALLPYDQKITNGSRSFGQQIGFESGHSYSGPIKMFPKNINSTIFRLGNGFTALLVGGGLLAYGAINHNYRALHTSSELMEGLLASGLLVQPFKRISGRESPFVAEDNGNNGGDWDLFPSFSAYQKNTPAYDGMPSGHITTLMTSVMIISENYKEIKWIKPVGFGMMGLMSFEMLQSKVHWASDYPIAIFMGYIIGKSIVKSRVTEKTTTAIGGVKSFKPKFHYSFRSNQNFTLVGANMIF